MRVLVTTFPGYGHFHPVAPLASAFQKAGHEVRVATDPGFGRWVEACGLRVLPAGLCEEDAVSEAADFPPQERAVRQFTTVAVPPFANDVLSASDRWRPDLVVSEEGEHAGPLIASVLGVLSTTHSWPAPARPPEERALREEALTPIWREFGQQEPPRLYGDVYLDCCPPPLQTAAVDGIDGALPVRPTLFDGPPTAAPPSLLDHLETPVVFVTLGTVAMFSDADTLRLLVEAVATEAATVIAATGPHLASVISATVNVRSARYVPLSAVLPVTDLVVSHGGASTTVACVLAGVPHLIVPQGAPSQRRTAAAVASLGIGATFGEGRVDAATVAATVRALLSDGEIHTRIDAVRATLEALQGPDDVARHLAGSI
jgi:UDP:flavonoid glycosyltransferase YjiC (YdhE family)